jgi:hypothetical protein
MAGHLDTNRRVCEMQFSQIMTFMATSMKCLPSPEVSRKKSQAMRNNRQLMKGGGSLNNSVWSSPALQKWADAKESALINVCGSFATRHQAQDFAIDAIDFIARSQTPIVWVLNVNDYSEKSEIILINILKHLILQILKMNHTLLTEKSLSLSAARFQSATTEVEWIRLLGSVLERLPYVYMIIDTEILGNQCEAKWSETFNRLFQELKTRNIETTIKVALIWYLQQPVISPGIGEIIRIRASTPSSRRPPTISTWRSSQSGERTRRTVLKLSHHSPIG